MRRLAIAAMIAGVLAGVLAAVAIPREREPAPRPLRQAPALTGTNEGAGIKSVRGSERVVARAAAPDGGPGWVLRTFSAREHFPTLHGVRGPPSGRRFCAQ